MACSSTETASSSVQSSRKPHSQIGKFFSVWNLKHRLRKFPISFAHKDVAAYECIRPQICAVLKGVPYMCTLLEVAWAETGERKSTVHIICPRPRDFVDGLKAIETELRIEILPGTAAAFGLKDIFQPPHGPGHSIGPKGVKGTGTLGAHVREKGGKELYLVTAGHVALMGLGFDMYPALASGREIVMQSPTEKDTKRHLEKLQENTVGARNCTESFDRKNASVESNHQDQSRLEAEFKADYEHGRLDLGDVEYAIVDVVGEADTAGVTRKRWKDFAAVKVMEGRGVNASNQTHDTKPYIKCSGELDTDPTEGNILFKPADRLNYLIPGLVVNGVPADLQIPSPLLPDSTHMISIRETCVLERDTDSEKEPIESGTGINKPIASKGDSGAMLFSGQFDPKAAAMLFAGARCWTNVLYGKDIVAVVGVKTLLRWMREATGKEFTFAVKDEEQCHVKL